MQDRELGQATIRRPRVLGISGLDHPSAQKCYKSDKGPLTRCFKPFSLGPYALPADSGTEMPSMRVSEPRTH